MSSRILSFRRRFSILILLGIIGLFAFAWKKPVSAADDKSIYFDQIEMRVQVVENPALTGAGLGTIEPTLEGSSYYTASLSIVKPQNLRVGEKMLLGPRNGAATIKGFGLGLIKTGQEESLCKNRGSHTTCDFPFTVPVQREMLSTGETAGGVVVLNKDIQAVLGLTDAERTQVTIYPFIETNDNQQMVLVGSKASLNQTGQVLPTTSDDNWIGDGILSIINTILGAVAAAITELLNALLFIFVAPFIEALLAIRTYTDDFAGIIYPAWEVFRNLSNIIFILAIIATGLATVFRVGGWQAKDILVKLIMGAILINFSLVIAQSVLGVADTIQNQFLPADTGAIRLLGKKLIVDGTRQTWDNIATAVSADPAVQNIFGTFGESVRILSAMITGIVAFIAFVAIAIFLGIRIVFLWLLLMTSPLPYVAMVLPVTRNISSRWWSNFIKYAFMTPAMAFMLNLSALIANRQQNVIQDLSAGRYANLNGTIEQAMFTLGANAVVIIFMFLSLKVASAFGAESGGLIEKVSDKGWRAAIGGAKLPYTATGWGLGALNRIKQERTAEWSQQGTGKRVAFALLNPITTTKAAIERRHQRQHEIEAGAAAGAYDVVPTVTAPLQKLGMQFGPKSRKYNAFRGSEYSKITKEEMPWINEDHALKQLGDLIKSGKKDEQTRTRVGALLIQLAEDADINDVLEDAEGLGLSRNYRSDRHGWAAFQQELMARGQLDHLQNGDLQARLSEIFKKTGAIEYMNQYREDKNGQLTSIHGELKKKIVNGQEVEEFEAHGDDDEKAWDKVHNAINKQWFKIGAGNRMSQHYSAWVNRANASGEWELNDGALEVAQFADDRDFAAAESLNIRSRVRMISALRDPEKYKLAIERSIPILARKLRSEGHEVDETADRAKLEEMAKANLDQFAEKILLYDVRSDTKLDRTQQHEGEELMKDPDFQAALNRQARSGQDRSRVIRVIDDAGYNRGSYKISFDKPIIDRFDNTSPTFATDVAVMQDKTFDHMKGLFAEKMDAIKVDLVVKGADGKPVASVDRHGAPVLDPKGKPALGKFRLDDIEHYKKQIADSMEHVMRANPDRTMKDLERDLQTDLAGRLAAELRKSDGSTVSATEAQKIAERIFSGFKRT